MSIIETYRIYCETESLDKYWYLPESDPAPTTCPTNTAHTVNLNSVAIIGRNGQEALLDDRDRTVVSQSPEARTYGRFSEKGYAFDAPGPAGTVTKFLLELPFAVDLREGQLLVSSQEGDIIRFEAAPGTDLNAVAGSGDLLTQAIAVNDQQVTMSVAKLNALVSVALIDAGLWELTFTEGATVNGPYLVKSYDPSTGIVQLGTARSGVTSLPAAWTGFDNAFTAAAVVTCTRVLVDSIELDGATDITFGDSADSSAPLPVGTMLCAVYTNNQDPDAQVRVRFFLDFFTGIPLS